MTTDARNVGEEENYDAFQARAEQLAQVAAGMKKRELQALDRHHPLVAILSKALDFKERQHSNFLRGGSHLAAALLERATIVHSSSDASPYPYLLVPPFPSPTPFSLLMPQSSFTWHLPAPPTALRAQLYVSGD